MTYTHEVQTMCPVAKGAKHDPAPIPQEGQWTKVKKVEEYSSYATLRINHSPKDVLVPFVPAFIKSVSLEEKKIVIKFIEGLL